MRLTEQASGLSILAHGRMVRDFYRDLLSHLRHRTPLRHSWRLPDWVCDPALIEGLPSDRVMARYHLFHDCGKPETLLSTNRHLLDKMPSAPTYPGVVVAPPVFISNTARIANSVIGPYATIADGATVRDAVIRNSIVSEDAEVSGALLEDSIIGNNAVVRGNWKHINVGDSSEIDFS